jgi:MFS family permease
VVDRFGPRVMLLPGVILMSLSTWLLAHIELSTSYFWLILIFSLRGLGVGSLVQTLTVSALSQVPPRQFAQASSLNTVIRFVFTSLGIAVLATLVQSRAVTHLATLARELKPSSPAAMELLSRQALNLALQDAFGLTLVAFLLAFLVICFIRIPKPVEMEKEDMGAEPPAGPERAAEGAMLQSPPPFSRSSSNGGASTVPTRLR